jgi:lysyl-tRNA synthetase class 1
MTSPQFDAEILNDAKAWPFVEARNLIKRLEKMKLEPSSDRPVLFETGYGPSGLPHIGTFGEVVRTTMVRKAFEMLTGHPTRLICFSDDMDGLRKVPDNVPQRDMMAQHLGKALTDVPDPFGTHDSFGAHNNARLQSFLDGFGFDYDLFSATDCYQSGRFDDALLNVLKNYDAVTNVVLPTLGEERQATYSPFMPVCPETREVLQAEITDHDVGSGTIEYRDPRDNNSIHQTAVTGGRCKLQWKCDWAMRWHALGVDYEMSGKDLGESVVLSSKIIQIIGGIPPEGFSYELFLDQNGEKISKSKGNGLSVEEWLTYGTSEALALFMYNQPKRAKRLFFDVVPKMVDEYFTHLEKYADAKPEGQVENPVWHIHGGAPPEETVPVSFSLLLNLAGVCQASTPEVIWGYLEQYASGISADSNPQLDRLVSYAVTYYQERVHPFKTYRSPTPDEVAHLQDLDHRLTSLDANAAVEDIQSAVFAAGKAAGYDPLRDWFACLYQVLLGQDEGPRMGSFIKLYGINETRQLISKAIDGTIGGDKS